MAQNFSRKENESETNRQTVTVRNYIGYSTADAKVLNVNDLVKNEDTTEANEQENKPQFIMVNSNIANRIEEELAKFWKSKKTICSLIRELNKHNICNFVKNMLTVSNSRTVLGDFKKYITYYELKHIVSSMLVAADELGFSDSSKYKMLLKEFNIIAGVCLKNSSKSIDNKTLNTVNMRLENLFEYISRSLH